MNNKETKQQRINKLIWELLDKLYGEDDLNEDLEEALKEKLSLLEDK